MTDIRLQRMAQVLVRYSLGIKKGDRLGIVTGPNAAPLVREVIREAIQAGAYPETFVDLPGGEFFTGPVEDSANGSIRYSFPASFAGRSVEDVRLRFENGVVVEARAAQGQDYLDKMLGLDEGARRLGEFAFGNNRKVDRCTKNTLFDEKMGGTVHLALGASIPETGGVNQSALHWDMVCDLRNGSEIRVDGELFSKNGEFAI